MYRMIGIFPGGEMVEFGDTKRFSLIERKGQKFRFRVVWFSMRSKFDEQIRLLNQDMMYMGTMIEDSIQKAMCID